jgi:hypothetical protein
MKPAAYENPLGFWEHLPIRDVAWSAIRVKGKRRSKSFREYATRGFLEYADPRKSDWNDEYLVDCKRQVLEMVAQDNVEMYKDPALPLIYPLFPKDAKYVFTTRNPRAGYHHAARRISFERFRDAYDCYYRLSRQMDVSTMFFAYEDFGTDFGGQVKKLAAFLGVKADIERLRKVYRPR